jgi:hypothetical protein
MKIIAPPSPCAVLLMKELLLTILTSQFLDRPCTTLLQSKLRAAPIPDYISFLDKKFGGFITIALFEMNLLALNTTL